MDREPLLGSEKTTHIVYISDPNAGIRQVDATTGAARRSRVGRSCVRRHLLLGLFTVWALTFWLWTNPPLGLLKSIHSTPLDGPLEMPGRDSKHYKGGQAFREPQYVFAAQLGSDWSLAVRQNTTQHQHRTEKPDEHWRTVRINGDVVVRRATGSSSGESSDTARIEVDTIKNDERIGVKVMFDAAAQVLSIVTDNHIWVEDTELGADGKATLVVRATVWVPETTANFQLKDLTINASHLGIRLADDLHLAVRDAVQLFSIVGPVEAARDLQVEPGAAPTAVDDVPAGYNLSAPVVQVKTTSGRVGGPWPLQQRLEIHTVSGNIGVAILARQKPEIPAMMDERKDVDVAELQLQAVSGTVTFREIVETVSRHRLLVLTTSGRITGSSAFVQTALVHSTSGPLDVTLTPLRASHTEAPVERVELDTKSVSGHTAVQIDEGDLGESLLLESRHFSVSGTLQLTYPTAWTGRVHLRTVSGPIAVSGPDVHVLPSDGEGHRPPWVPHVGHSIEAIKGLPVPTDGPASDLRAQATSGSVMVFFSAK